MKLKPGQQFRIDSFKELREAYEKLSPWQYTFEEIEDFCFQGNLWISLNSLGNYDIGCRDYGKEAVPNPLKKEKPEPFSTVINNLIKESDMIKKRDELRKELNELRREIEAMKEKELNREKQESINEIHKIMRESLASKECCKEKPKESPDLKIKHPSCELTLKEVICSYG